MIWKVKPRNHTYFSPWKLPSERADKQQIALKIVASSQTDVILNDFAECAQYINREVIISIVKVGRLQAIHRENFTVEQLKLCKSMFAHGMDSSSCAKACLHMEWTGLFSDRP
eukprot:scaffold204501_cov34-Prasinocladus_malaysianus.AAC.1